MDEELKAILAKNNALIEEANRLARRTHRYVVLGQVMGWIQVLAIVVPLIVGYTFLKPYLSNLSAIYAQGIVPEAAGNLPGLINNAQTK